MDKRETRVVLVTGAAGGIGAASARRFATGGWEVAVTDRETASLAEIADDLEGLGRLACALPGDLRSISTCREIVTAAAEKNGLDCLVSAAGVWTEGPAEETTEAEWDWVLDVNLKALYFLAVAAIPHLVKTEGSIINMSSDAGIQGNAGAAVYSASKGGVTNLTRALALELAPRGVRVNAVCPGDVDTPMLRAQAADFGGDDPEGYFANLLSEYPQKDGSRFIKPGEVAELIWYLAQPHAAPITGANISIDFGLSSGI